MFQRTFIYGVGGRQSGVRVLMRGVATRREPACTPERRVLPMLGSVDPSHNLRWAMTCAQLRDRQNDGGNLCLVHRGEDWQAHESRPHGCRDRKLPEDASQRSARNRGVSATAASAQSSRFRPG